MKLTKIFLIISLTITGHFAFSQARFTEDRNKFTTDLKAVMEASKNEQAVKIAQTFDGLWNGGSLSDKQKQQIFSIAISMQKKRYKVNPQYMGYFSLFNSAVLIKSMKGVKLDSLIYVTSQVLENHPINQFQKYLDFTNTFLEQNKLYNSNFNRLNVQASNFSIWYIDPKTVNNADAAPVEPAVSSVEKLQDENADWGTSFSDDAPKEKGSKDVNMSEVLDSETPPEVVLPAISGPIIRVSNATFNMASKNDSVSFSNVKGTAMAFNNLFVGEKATFNWSYAGLKAEDVFAVLDKFSMNLSKQELYAENASFTYKGKIEKPIKGSFAFKSLNRVDKTNTPYPAFASYSNKINLGNIGEGLSLSGGFSLSGKIINTASADMGNSTLTYIKAGVVKFKAISKGFQITDSAVNSRQAAIIIPFSGDSITHLGAKLSFLKGAKLLKLTQANGNSKNMSYYDTYHKLEISSEAALYDISKEKMDFYVINARNQTPVKLSSFEYFEEDKYDQLKGLFPFHPLQVAIGFSKSGKGNSFYSDDLANSAKQNPATMRSAMAVLAQEGFAEYNAQTGFVKLTKKAWHFYLSKMNKKDFDGIQLVCLSPQKTNVTLDMVSKKMVGNGIKRAYLCRPLNVYMETDSTGEVIIEKNRNMTFNGTVNAGRFLFTGRNYKFDYDSFMVKMGKVDGVNINISKDFNIGIYGGENMKHKRLGIELDQSRGDLYINKPANKSGKRSMPQYPIFHASAGGVVYFDKKEILGGAYDRNLLFKIPPFTVDSLNSEQEQAIAFNGTFISNGIFPDFKEKLTLQSDLSLGFEHTTPADGYPIYGKKGRFYEKISLNMLGIRGSGKLETMGSTINSEDLIFYPDSLIAIGNNAEVKKISTPEVHHPDINIEEHEVKWYPKKDTLVFQTFNKPFSLYSKEAEFDGKVGLTSKAAFGDGKMTTHNSEIVSKKHQLKEESFQSRYANFKINSADKAKPNMVSSNSKIEFDLKASKAIISPEVEGYASDTFPYIQYSTSISRCEWDLQKQTLTMGNKKDLKASVGTFYNISPEADSLSFMAGYAFYDIKKQYLKVKGVPYVRVSDSEILPDSNSLVIVEGGKMETLSNAIVRMDTLNKFHKLDNARIDIVSRKEFKGTAVLDFTSSEKEKHKIKVVEFLFPEVAIEITSKRKSKSIASTKRITVAKTAVSEEEKLHISQGILFKGDMDLHSNKKNPVFNGFVKLDLKRNNSVGSWLAFQRIGDSSEVVINLSDAKSDNGEAIKTGLHLTVDGTKLYSSFISTKENDSDKDVFKVTGNLKFDPNTKEYIVAEPKKMANNFAEGNLLSLNDNSSVLHYEGKAQLIQPFLDYEITTGVVGKGNLDSSNYSFNTLMCIPMTKINPAALASMGANISSYAAQNNAPYANDYTDVLRLKLVNVIGQKAFDSYEKQVGQGNQKLLGSINKLSTALVLSQLNFVWSPTQSAYYSKGTVGVSNILKKEVNAMVEGFAEIRRTTSGDALRILLTPNADKWYYISFEGSRLALCSNDEEFTKSVLAKSKGESVGKLSFVAADPSEKVQFNKDFNMNYLGKEIFDEYKPADGSTPIESLPAEEIVPEKEEIKQTETTEKDSKKKKKKEIITEESAPAETTPESQPADSEKIISPEKEETGKKKKKKKEETIQESIEQKQGF